MIPRQARLLLYALATPLMWTNARFYRHVRAPRNGVIKVHIGPGRAGYLPGWINVDANILTAKIDLWADISKALPFDDNTVTAIYSHHVIEHLPDLYQHFREMHRVLKPGGVFRVGGPHGEMAARKLVEGDIGWFSSDFPDNRRSIGGRFENFVFCAREHVTILTQSFLAEIAQEAGFPSTRVCRPVSETSYPEIIDRNVLALEWEDTPDHPHTLIVEGQKL